jgi:hypothetical protein
VVQAIIYATYRTIEMENKANLSVQAGTIIITHILQKGRHKKIEGNTGKQFSQRAAALNSKPHIQGADMELTWVLFTRVAGYLHD